MKQAHVKILVILIFTFSVLLILRCQKVKITPKGETPGISGELIIQLIPRASAPDDAVIWPGDTTSVEVYLLTKDSVFIKDDNEQPVCDSIKPEFVGQIGDRQAEILYNLTGLETGDYRVGFYYSHNENGSEEKIELFTFYHPDLEYFDRFTEIEKADEVILTDQSPTVKLEAITLKYIDHDDPE